MNILGISCFYHDSAACLVQDGRITAAASEERFNRSKCSPAFPLNAINYCLQHADLTMKEINAVGFYEKPFLKFYRVLLSHARAYPFSFGSFCRTLPGWLKERLFLPLILRKELCYEGRIVFINHHLSHAASSFLVSPFEEAAILIADGVGEWASTSFGVGSGVDVRIAKELHFPNSLGLFYSAITTYLGFEALTGEGKVMGLAGYGSPVYVDKFKKMVIVRPDGSFMLDQRYFGFNKGGRMYTEKLIQTLGKERRPQDKVEQRHCDVAASLQKITEDILINIVRNVHKGTGMKRFCLAGGLFMNCVANARILEDTPVKELFIQPASGDSGGALGAAVYVYHYLSRDNRRTALKDVYLGPEFYDREIKRAFINGDIVFREYADDELLKYIAGQIAQDRIVGWFQGRMEFGPRALGNRSILANPCNPRMKDLLNLKVKRREDFRPYAPAVLEERCAEFFDVLQQSPFMLIAGRVKEEKKGVIPAVTHIDNTARVQIVDNDTNSRLRGLLKEFENLTGIPLLINTSFNLRGEPIVCRPEDAIDCFKRSEMDILVMGNCVAERNGIS